MTDNTIASGGYGSAININSDNGARAFNIKGKINISGNSVYLHSTQAMTIVGEIEDGSVITIVSTSNAFAKGDGVNVTDISGYAKYFVTEDNQKVSENSGSLFVGEHVHAICGLTCTHSGSHGVNSYSPVSNLEELKNALTSGGNYYLVNDIEVSAAITVSKATNLCLNGKIISAAAGESLYTIFKASNPLTITDCSNTQRVGYIDPTSDRWVEGTLDGATSVTLTGGIIMGGHGEWGGAINSTAAVEIYHVNFVNNNATSCGGAIYVNGAHTLKVHGVTFVANSTAADGGAIYVTAGSVTADGNNRFLYNKSNRGGAIYLVKNSTTGVAATLNMSDGSFVGNHSTGDGGAIHIRSTCTATFTSTAFNYNSATGTGSYGGGAIFTSWATLNLNLVNMTDNSITNGLGAGIYSDNSTVNVKYALDSDKTALESLIGSSGSSHKLTFTQQ